MLEEIKGETLDPAWQWGEGHRPWMKTRRLEGRREWAPHRKQEREQGDHRLQRECRWRRQEARCPWGGVTHQSGGKGQREASIIWRRLDFILQTSGVFKELKPGRALTGLLYSKVGTTLPNPRCYLRTASSPPPTQKNLSEGSVRAVPHLSTGQGYMQSGCPENAGRSDKEEKQINW